MYVFCVGSCRLVARILLCIFVVLLFGLFCGVFVVFCCGWLCFVVLCGVCVILVCVLCLFVVIVVACCF